jgi:hypothetical protein
VRHTIIGSRQPSFRCRTTHCSPLRFASSFGDLRRGCSRKPTGTSYATLEEHQDTCPRVFPGHLRRTAGAVRIHSSRAHTCPPEGHTCPDRTPALAGGARGYWVGTMWRAVPPLRCGTLRGARGPSRPRLRTRRVSRAHPKGASGRGSRPERGAGPGWCAARTGSPHTSSPCRTHLPPTQAVSPPLAHPEGVACTPEGCVGPGLAASRTPSQCSSGSISEGDERGAGSGRCGGRSWRSPSSWACARHTPLGHRDAADEPGTASPPPAGRPG